jgi:hypothetical protein
MAIERTISTFLQTAHIIMMVPTATVIQSLALRAAGLASRGAFVQAIRRTPFLTALLRQFDSSSTAIKDDVPMGIELLEQEQRRIDDMIYSVKYIEQILENLEDTQARQRKLFLEQADLTIYFAFTFMLHALSFFSIFSSKGLK